MTPIYLLMLTKAATCKGGISLLACLLACLPGQVKSAGGEEDGLWEICSIACMIVFLSVQNIRMSNNKTV